MSGLCHLYLEGECLSAWQQGKGQARRRATFTNTPDGLAQFSEFLAVDRKKRFALLVNLPDENFAREKLPRLRNHERKQLLASRSQRLFPETPWRCIQPNGKGVAGETDYLLMALGKPASLMPWLERLNAANAALESVHSLPQLLPQLLRKQAPITKFLIALSLHENAARLSLLIDGRLHWSRLARLSHETTLQEEYRRFVEHASRQNPLEHPLDHAPSLCVIAATEQQAEIDLPNIVARIETQECNSAKLFLSIPHKQWPHEQFAPPAQRRHALLGRQTSWLWRAAIATSLLGATISLERMSQRAAAQAVIEQERVLRQSIDDELRQSDRQLVHSGLTHGQLQQLAQDYPRLLHQQNTFETSLLALSRNMDESPAIRLDSIDWKIDGFPPSTVSMRLTAWVSDSKRPSAEMHFRQFHARLKQAHTTSLLEALPASPTESGFPFAIHASRHEPR